MSNEESSPEKPGSLVHCSFCDKDQIEVEQLISGVSAYICNDCIAEIKGELDPASNMVQAVTCSFCEREVNDFDHLYRGGHSYRGDRAHICDGCVELCVTIIEEKPNPHVSP